MRASEKNSFYITTTLPYVNAKPHVGFAREIVEADVLARFYRQQGYEVFFNTGTDEHGKKIQLKAQEKGLSPQEYCDQMVLEFGQLKKVLNLSFDNFIRTTDSQHIKAVQEFWKLCQKKGDIYKKKYLIKYCVGCELEKTDSELVNGKCPDHPNLEIELIEEENYFFRFSNYQDKLLNFYQKNPNFVVPTRRMNEIKSFVEQGLQDFSISRLKNKMEWGVPVPGDDQQVIYVWFDALVNYISALGWPSCAKEVLVGNSEDISNFEKFWPGIQVCGKDNLRQQSAMWQAMLMSAGLPNSLRIFVNGFITVGGKKMSKSLGNVISPYEMVEKFGVDATRYLLLAGVSFGEDFDITWEKMIEKYNADLANGLGNLLSRVIKLSQKDNFQFSPSIEGFKINFNDSVFNFLNRMEFNQVLGFIWEIIRQSNQYIDINKPWKLIKTNKIKFKQIMDKLLIELNSISELLKPFMPETSDKIKKALKSKKLEGVLFARIK